MKDFIVCPNCAEKIQSDLGEQNDLSGVWSCVCGSQFYLEFEIQNKMIKEKLLFNKIKKAKIQIKYTNIPLHFQTNLKFLIKSKVH